MESRAYALITGLFVLGIAGCIVVWAHWLAKTPLERKPYRVVATIPVSGLNPEAQVRYRGMGVGRVSTISLDKSDPRRILIDVEVDKEIPITKGTYAQLGMEGITGIAYVHLHDDYKNMQPAEKGPAGLVELPLRPAFFDVISDGAEGVVKDARELAGQITRLSSEAQGTAGAMREDTLPRVNALAESVERGAQRVGRMAAEIDRQPESLIWGKKPVSRPGPGEKGFE